MTVLGAAAAALLAAPQPAEACGGTFCDAGPQAMPVDQTGEVVLFVMGEEETEAHIQIQYDPNAEADEFAWVVPLTEIPEFSVGSDALFDNVLAGTVPSYGFSRQFDSCGDDGLDGGDEGAGGDTGGGDSTGGATGGPDTPEIVFEETVGAFDIVVLEGGTPEEVVNWLTMNGYQQDPAATPIFEEYLAENYVFAAFRLTNGAEVSEIHPITLTFPNNEACVPLRLTRIAAVDDMDIRTFFLADDRVVPETYKHVLINPLKLDWSTQGGNYKELIAMAVDADEANGRAFVTEYAGPSAVVPTGGIYSRAWDAAPFAAIDPVDVVGALEGQGLMSCFDDGVGGGSTTSGVEAGACQYDHLLLRGLLQQFLPVPDSIEEIDFYGCLSCYEGLIDPMAWDGAAFAAALQERIIDPGQHAASLLESWPYITRMYTTISPAEMTADPFFHVNPDLEDVDLTNQIATRRTLCNGDDLWTLPNGDEVYSPNGWPSFDDEMPWEEEVSEIAEAGAPIVLVDRSQTIDVQLEQHNCVYNYPSPAACGNDPEPGEDTGGSDDSFPGDGDGTDDTGGDDGTGGSGGQNDATGGCGCTTSTTPNGGGLAFALFGIGLLATRRRR
ncbi:MAG: DUF2330 domain-containing protein [Myxococcota bacterium]